MKKAIFSICLVVMATTSYAAEGNYPPATAMPASPLSNQLNGAETAPKAKPLSVEDYLGADTVPLSPKEKRSLSQSKQWAGGGAAPLMGAGGKLLFVHGQSLPTIIGAPLQVVDVELQKGEVLHEIIVGDSARWMVETGMAGDTPHIFIKAVDSGLESSAVVTTDTRVYHLRLISQKSGHTPYVGFLYTDTLRQRAAVEKKAQEKEQKWATMSDGADLSKLNFNYRISGDNVSWKPERVYDDGQQTFIRLPSSTKAGEMPVLLVRKNGDNILVNYRVKDQAMVVDGVFKHIVLIVGVGSDQDKVEVRRK